MLTMLIMLLVRASSIQALRVTPTHLFLREISKHKFYDEVSPSIDTRSLPTAARLRYATSVTRNAMSDSLGMENLYTEWTLSQDKLLWENRSESLSTLAVLLGRGLRGTEQRLAKLNDVNSSAYHRLFVSNASMKSPADDSFETNSKKKLVPSSEVLRRIQWDDMLSSEDFSVVYYDRVDDSLVETPLDAPNLSIPGKATKFIDALPEHRIVSVKYKERIVWDREQRLDLVFGDDGIAEVIRGYDEWKKMKDEDEERYRQRKLLIVTKLQEFLGLERFDQLYLLWDTLTAKAMNDPTMSLKMEAERYVRSTLNLFKEAWKESEISVVLQTPSDLTYLELLSEFVAMCTDSKMRPYVLDEIYIGVLKAEGKLKMPSPRDRKLPELNEWDLTETFIRGTGPGGQKVNKTSSRVCLVHEPTQLRVECQETRSLPQNRKIARKRLQEKLDEFLNGSQSKANLKALKLSKKKAKAKNRSRARMQEKKSLEEFQEDDSDEE